MQAKCKHCDYEFFEDAKFCSKCGKPIAISSEGNKEKTLNLIIGFYVAILIFAIISSYIDSIAEQSFLKEILVETIFAIIIIVFCTFNWKENLKLYRFPKINFLTWGVIFLIPFLSSTLVYFFIEIMSALGYEVYNYYETYSFFNNPLFWAIIFVAVFPAVFEELAFRGFLFNQLKKITTSKLSIIATAFIFALIHFSLISFLWIFPFGLLLGYLRNKYHTLWLGMIIHFIHNLIIILLEYREYQSFIID